MKHKHLKTTLIVATVLMSGFGAYRSYSVTENNKSMENNLTLKNVLALTDNVRPESACYYLHHFNCKFHVTTQAQAAILKASVGATVDLGYLTQYFNEVPDNGEGPCEKGNQVTCNEAVFGLLGHL